MTNEPWFQATTLAIAMLGALLGVMNWWRNWNQDRVRIRVSTTYAMDGLGGDNFCITIINLSSFAVTVDYIGFKLHGTERHVQIARPIFVRGESLPLRLEPRAAATVLQPFAAFENHDMLALRQTWIKTACGHQARGSRRALGKIVHAAFARSLAEETE